MILGITGVFGSGKTTIAKMFSRYGYKHINADEIGHLLLNRRPIKDKIIEEFGRHVLTNGRIDRKKLKNTVFYNHKKLARLNKIIHKPIIEEIRSIIKGSKNKNIMMDGALLIEAGALNLVDRLIVVKINKKEQLKRALKKGKYNEKEINTIIRSQLSQKEKLKYADYIIDNSKGPKHSEKRVKEIIKSSENA